MPSCKFLIGHVLDDIVIDGRDIFLSWTWIFGCVLLSFVPSWFEKNSRDASAMGENILN